MAGTNKTDFDYADTLWKAADALRGEVDAARRRQAPNKPKYVVLGLLLLDSINDSFKARRDELRAELAKDGDRFYTPRLATYSHFRAFDSVSAR